MTMQQFQSLFGGSPLQGAQPSAQPAATTTMPAKKAEAQNPPPPDKKHPIRYTPSKRPVRPSLDPVSRDAFDWLQFARDSGFSEKLGRDPNNDAEGILYKKYLASFGKDAANPANSWKKDVARVEKLGGGGLSVDIKNNLGLLSPTPGFTKSTGNPRSKFTSYMKGGLGKPPAKQKPAVTNEMGQLAALIGGQ